MSLNLNNTGVDAVKQFLARFADKITGVLSGFDRLVFRGTLIPLVRERGLYTFLKRAQVRLLDFKDFALSVSERVKERSLSEAVRAERPVRYLESPSISKEDLARKLLDEHPVDRGVICAFKTLEPCMSFEYHRSRDRTERGFRLRPRKCMHVYKYYRHPVFGFMNARIQTWFPFNIQICMNGREWLASDFARKGRDDYRRHDNCFLSLGNPALAQRWMDRQLQTDWRKALDTIAEHMNPLHEEIFAPWPMTYHWSAYQTEWATDVLFKDPESLASVYPAFVRHATLHFQSEDVLRFLGRKSHGNFLGELTTSFKDRAEGVRVKHWVAGNSIKMYDKAGSVLRVETTIAKTAGFKVYRPLQGGDPDELAWRPLRKGVADLHRRAEVSQRSNETYLEALAAVECDTPVHRLLDDVSKPVTYRDRRVRALRIGDAEDVALLGAIARGEFATAGFRNRDLRPLLHPAKKNATAADHRRLAAKVSRQLRMLRAHGLIQKVQRSHRYRVTDRGRLVSAALFAAREATLGKLLAKAA